MPHPSIENSTDRYYANRSFARQQVANARNAVLTKLFRKAEKIDETGNRKQILTFQRSVRNMKQLLHSVNRKVPVVVDEIVALEAIDSYLEQAQRLS